jgi:histidyl-tRNA synthetase
MGMERVRVARGAWCSPLRHAAAHLCRRSAAALVLAMRSSRRRGRRHPVLMHAGGGHQGSSSGRASGARYALIFGADELAQGQVGLKPLRDASATQSLRPLADVPAWAHELRNA